MKKVTVRNTLFVALLKEHGSLYIPFSTTFNHSPARHSINHKFKGIEYQKRHMYLWTKATQVAHAVKHTITPTKLTFTTRVNDLGMTNSSVLSTLHSNNINPLVNTYVTKSSINSYKTVIESNEKSVDISTPHKIGVSQNIIKFENKSCPPEVIQILSRIATIKDCIDLDLPTEDWGPMAHTYNTTNGSALQLLDYLGTSTQLFADVKFANFNNVFPKELWAMFTKVDRTLLKTISIKSQNSLLYEIVAKVFVNKDLEHNRLGFAYKNTYRHEADLSCWTTYLNNTRNNHPDYVLLLNVPVDVHGQKKDLIAYDFKFGQLQPPVNIVKACTNDHQLGAQLRLIHRELGVYLKTSMHTFSLQDNPTAKTLIHELDYNLATFKNTKNLQNFRGTYHSLQEKFHPFFLRNGVGFNFLVKISPTDLGISQERQFFFSERYKTYMSSQKTVVSEFAQKIAIQNSSMDVNSIIQDFTKYLLTRQ